MQLAGSIAPEALLEKEYSRTKHLKSVFFEELSSGSNMLVRTESQGETDADFKRLAVALHSNGASPLLRVKAVGATWKPEPIRPVGDKLFEGSIRWFSIQEAWAVDLEPWVHLCDAAYAAQYDLPVQALGAPHRGPNPITFNTRLRHHVGQAVQSGHTSFMKAVDPTAFDPASVYVFSAWVWIPAECKATKIFAACGLQRLGWVDADLGIRERWQRIWAAGRFNTDEAPNVPVGLGMIGGETDEFWSCRSKCHVGALPHATNSPQVRPYPAPARWFTRWFDHEKNVPVSFSD